MPRIRPRLLTRSANISLSTVRDFETGTRTPIANNIAAMRRAIEEAGIEFADDDREAVGNPAHATTYS